LPLFPFFSLLPHHASFCTAFGACSCFSFSHLGSQQYILSYCKKRQYTMAPHTVVVVDTNIYVHTV
jgi:hypothetical protein